MITYTLKDIAEIIHVKEVFPDNPVIGQLVIDSRKIVFPENSLFFALNGPRRDGHTFISEVYERGVRNFVVKRDFDFHLFPDANFLQVDHVLHALQQLAAFHRSRFDIPVIGITGSNGKTIVKEWLYQLLNPDYTIVRSPRSYNSQIGVPLSVWQMNTQHTLAIFEAGISTVNEMDALAKIIQPTIGVMTNIADAHREGFTDNRQKALEKIKLCKQVANFVFGKEAIQPFLYPEKGDSIYFEKCAQFFSWSRNETATLKIITEEKKGNETAITGLFAGKAVAVTMPFTDRISIDNAITCWGVLLSLKYEQSVINERMLLLEPVDMRMQLKKGINNCYILNDSYSNDLASLDLALDYLQQQAGNQSTTLILSDLLESGYTEEDLYKGIEEKIKARAIHRLIGIGSAISAHGFLFDKHNTIVSFYPTTDIFLHQSGIHQFSKEYILLKGARVFEFEKISHWLEQKVHQTVMEINLTALANNLKLHQAHLLPSTRLMAMVKAFSYGSGTAEVARVLQFHKVDYLAVAYTDEGVELRKAGTSLPIMVMNVDEAGFDAMVNYDLEPEIYSFPIYHAFHHYLSQQGLTQFPVHIKFNTGMNRLGFETGEAEALAILIREKQTMAVKSVFSHLVASEAAEHDGFTQLQVRLFEDACLQMKKIIGYDFIRHIANSAAIYRNPAYQFDMVRLGIGLYGVNSSDEKNAIPLETVTTLKSTIAQVRHVKAGETVGYGRKGKLERDSIIATVRIGYADGFGRELGNGNGKMFLKDRLVPVIGNVCMDMTMIDVTDLPGTKEGDMVEIFGKHLPVQDLAGWADTIPYEIMTGISQRVKRVYVEE